ncbi:MAG: glycogen/starch synthase [Desulfobulbaceae bacterium]|nr:glycogen/starch synthase [Desulfobulbaceae bacterium]
MSKTEAARLKIRNVWMVTREYDGLAGAGGVKDVCRQLSEALVRHGRCRVSVVLPRYGFIDPKPLGFSRLQLPAPAGAAACSGDDALLVDLDYAKEIRRESVAAWHGKKSGVDIYLLEAGRFAEKLGIYTYTAEEERLHSWQKKGSGHYDYFAMNVLLQKSALALMMVLGEKPDVIHCQDGHTALIPAMLRENEGYRHFFRYTGAVVTIHNAGTGYHQEVDDLDFARAITGLPLRVIDSSLLNLAFDPFLAASDYAVMNTVSAQYARELQKTQEDIRTGRLGHALLDRNVILAGITNGINPDDFDPTKPDKLGLKAGFDVKRGRLEGKLACKKYLQHSLSRRKKRARVTQYGQLLMQPEQPLYTFIGRLTHQKGVDLLIETFAALLQEKVEFQLVVLGSGEPEIEAVLRELAEKEEFSGQICLLLGYDQDLALKVYAAGDFFLIPSLFEPCGLTDYIAQLLGAIPIVHHVGGLVKVIDGRTGFSYEQHSAAALTATVRKSLEIYRSEPETIRRMQIDAVREIREKHTWKEVMQEYLDLYREAIILACTAGAGGSNVEQ